MSQLVQSTSHPAQFESRSAQERDRQKPRDSARPPPVKSFEFVSVDEHGRLPSDRRKFIRSHVMRGKNTAKRKSNKKPDAETNTLLKETGELSVATATRKSPDNEGGILITTRKQSPPPLTLTRSPDYGLQAIPFSGHTNYMSLHLINQFVTTMKHTMHPVDMCCSVDPTSLSWFHWLLEDTAYFNSVLFCVSAITDCLTKQENSGPIVCEDNLSELFSTRTRLYFRQTVIALQAKIEDCNRQLEDTTMACIMTLALVADAVGDNPAYETHMRGLAKLVEVRGGLENFIKHRQMLIKLSRIDLGWTIKTGNKPIIFPNYQLCKSLFSHIPPKQPSNRLHHLLYALDRDLCDVYISLQDFSNLVNDLFATKTKMDREHFEDVLISTQYKLLSCRFSVRQQPILEAIRIGLLAYEAILFVQTPFAELRCDYLARRLKLAIDLLDDAATPVLRDVRLWLLMIGSISTLIPEDTWVLQRVADLAASDSGWDAVRQRLENLIWIEVVHDHQGQRLYGLARRAPVYTYERLVVGTDGGD